MRKSSLLALVISALAIVPVASQTDNRATEAPVVQPGGDNVENYSAVPDDANYVRRVVMIPMRDGVRLNTIIYIPRGSLNAPILLDRTPYGAAGRSARSTSAQMLQALPFENEAFVKAGYIIVWQDVRGKFGSEGEYVLTRPLIGPLNKTNVDHSTDAYDTIDWLVKKANLPESNGRVGMLGSSYEGTTTAMALFNPHPALKVAAPQSPLIDGWMGDDWFHHGAFRQLMIGFVAMQTAGKAFSDIPSHGGTDDYEAFRAAGSVGDWARARGFDRLPAWRRFVEHPTYDAMWQGMALDKILAANPSDVPTIWMQGLWDQEDIYGTVQTWEAMKKAGKIGNNHLVLGPWYHSQVNRKSGGYQTGPLKWRSDTVADYWQDILLPFFNQHLKDGPPADLAAATVYNTGEDRWERLNNWPLACESGCVSPLTPLYLAGEEGLSFHTVATGTNIYVSDPAKPVPFMPRPFSMQESVYAKQWPTWLLSDQRSSDGRQDVMTYQSEILSEAVRVSGAPIADIFARTTGTDGDFVVKVIDVYPSENATNPELGGYQLPISLDIFRGRYRDSFENPSPIPAGKVQRYKFRLPTVNHVFKPGHRIMVQVQSSLFPLYDRNPQTYVANIFKARKSDYRAATVTIERGGATPSRVWLPIVAVDQSAATAR